jgi:peptidyl-prolyl cis-trans isomerase SurA
MRSTPRPTLFLLFLLLAPLFGGACGGNQGAVSSGTEEVAAVVNGTSVLVKDVDRIITQQFRGQENQLSALALASYRMQALDNLISQEVLFQRAQKEKIAPSDDEIRQYIQRYKQENSYTEEAFAAELKQTNQTEEQFRQFVRKQLAIQKLSEKTEAQLKVQDREVADVFNTNPQQFSIQPGVAISDIIIDPADNGMKFDVQGDAAAEQRIREIYTRLKNGSDFATVARQLSEHESSLRSGDLGFLPQSQFGSLPQMMGLPPVVGERLMAMREGDIFGPIKDSAGRWHIFKLTGKQTESRDRTLDDPAVRKEISEAILGQRKQVVAAALQARARDEARIENYLAQRMLENPNSFGVLRPVPSASPAAANPQSSPSSTPTP